MTVNLWSTTAATNATVDSTINWREGQAASTVNNSSRAMMAAIAKWRNDISGNILTTGSSTAYAITTSQGLTPLVDGYTVTARIHVTSGASPTLNVDATGAIAIRTHTSTAPTSGAMRAGSVQSFTYDSSDSCWYVAGYFANAEFASGTKLIFQQTAAPTGWTKETGFADHALRLTSGTVSSGGSVSFTTAFTSKTVAGTVGDTALSINQLPAHTHTDTKRQYDSGVGGGSGTAFLVDESSNRNEEAQTTPTTSSSVGSGATHTHTFTGTAINMAVAYADVILATKD